jgi:malonyl-CoA O-methyltransferase
VTISPTIDKRWARRAFERAALRYDSAAVLQREVGERLLERLQLVRLVPTRVLDLGCGTGVATARLLAQYPDATVLALDFALPMLHLAGRRGRWWRRPRCLCADVEHLPLTDVSIDLVFSNLTLQWCNDLPGTFRELGRVLRPGGLLLFSTLGPDTLRELRASWSAADGHSHVSPFTDLHDIGDLLLHTGFADPVMDAEWLTLTYPEVDGLMTDLRLLGAHNVTAERGRGLTGKGRFAAMRSAYEGFRGADGRLPASYEVVYGHAWAPTQRPTSDGVAIPVEVLRRPRAPAWGA